MPYVTATLSAITLFFVMTLCFGSNPYARLDWIPPDGTGLNPQLQNPGMAIHPPNLYLGYIGTAIPFAFAIAALITRRLDAGWLAAVRRWTLVSWFFNTTGIILGMWWAYVELGWGGYWAWDPVENASFLPWLVNTAFLHSIMVQEKRGMLRKWNVTLVVSAFLLAILGTFITRSGVISSVHSFAQSNVGTWFLELSRDLDRGNSVSRRDAAQRSRGEGGAREPGEPGGELPLQQSAARRHRLRGALGHALPDSERGGDEQQDHGRSAVLQQGEHSRSGSRCSRSRASDRSSRGAARPQRI